MKKIIVKILFIILIFSMMAGNLYICYAREDEGGGQSSSSSSSSSIGTSDTVDTDAYKPKDTTPGSAYTNAVGNILGAIQYIGTIVSVLVLAVLGVKYMLGSVEQKAEYKKDMLPYIIGAVLLFSGTNLAQFIYSVMNG